MLIFLKMWHQFAKIGNGVPTNSSSACLATLTLVQLAKNDIRSKDTVNCIDKLHSKRPETLDMKTFGTNEW